MSEKTHKQDDEELVIDFSKIKGWFKSSKKEKAEHKTAHEKSEHKTAHKSEHKAEHAHHKEHAHEGHAHKEHHEPKSHDHPEHKKEEDSPLDLKAVVPFMKKYGVVFLILIPIILTVFIRLQPAYLPVTDDWARSSVYDFYRNQMASQINQQYPNLPDANKKALLDAEFAKFTEQNQAMIDQQISATSQGFKDRLMYESGDSKYVYLGDIDSYFWLREVRKLERTGRNCDEIDYEKELCYVDTYTMAPLKSPSPLNTGKASPYSYTILYIYRVMKLFNPDTTIMQASFYTPLIYAILSAILAFLVGRAIAGNLAGLVTSVIISVNPIYLSRTMGSDNDPQNMFYPLLIVFFFIYALETKDLKKRLALGALTGLSIALYAWAWQGWWYMFDFLIGTMAILLGFHIVRTLLHNRNLKNLISNNEIQKTFTSLVTIFIASGIFIPIFTNSSTFLNAIRSPFWFMRTKIAALESFWPNVLVTVAEFNPGSLNTIVSQMGGKLLFFLGLAGILFVIVVRKKGKLDKYQKWLLGIGLLIYLFLVSDYALGLGPKTYMALLVLPVAIGLVLSLKSKDAADVKMAILLVIWFVATTYAALKGVRFTLLMVAAFGVAFGITIAMIYKFISQWISKELKINEIITKAVIAVLLLLILITPVKAGYVVGKHFIPSVNDAWYDSLTNIRDNSEPDAIINSWWDFGHWFKYIADRRVTLDGSSQGGPPLHWL
ncbi:hypothetical protein KY362_05380, partial [Candidatus Woesearchaeota archaeon]|nr:hypothetical protein [Candidatus Woesearchaeota archaeon]